MKAFSSRNTVVMAAALAVVMCMTRFSHFGTAIHLPDASMAVFFLGGLYVRRHLAFFGYAALAGALDFASVRYAGTSDFCITPAYSFLLPAYAVLWYAGRLYADRLQATAGSLVAALGSWMMARRAGGEWIVRMEDIDAPREVPGAADRQLNTLAAFGMPPDGPVVRQSQRGHLYQAALDRLLALLDEPEAIPVLAPLVERELLYRLLTADHGAMLHRIALGESRTAQISGKILMARSSTIVGRMRWLTAEAKAPF